MAVSKDARTFGNFMEEAYGFSQAVRVGDVIYVSGQTAMGDDFAAVGGDDMAAQMREAYALAEKVSASWVAFARTGDPNVSGLPKWPAYSAGRRDTMLFNDASRVEPDPDRGPRLVMEKLLKLA